MKKLIKFLTNWNEFLTIPLAIVIWVLSPRVLRWIDPTSATYDAGVLQICVFVVIQFLIYHGVAWLIMKITFPKLYKYVNEMFDVEFENISKWQRLKVVLSVFALYLVALVLIAKAV